MSVLFLFLSAFFVAFGITAYAETVEEKKAAANYDETLPVLGEARVVEGASLVQQVPEGAQPVQAIVPPVRAVPSATTAEGSQTPGRVQPSPEAPKLVSQDMPQNQVFTTSNPSGLVEISGYKYPVFFFAPKDYRTDRTYAMIMITPAQDAKAEEQIEYLTGLAQRKGLFILAPFVFWPKEGDTPYRLDEWLLTVKRDMVERFPISKKRIYLVGKDLGAHYAAYMAIKYPKEFAAVALLGQAWDGPFSQLIRLRTDAADQVPFYIALKANGEARSRNQGWFDELQKKGYPLHLVDYKSDEELNDLEFKKSIFDWMESTGQSWKASVAQGQKTWKGKFKKGVKNFFAI
ncbi:MAG: hypothetical protein ABH891_05885 [Candidatus Omnitrophota bacterium]